MPGGAAQGHRRGRACSTIHRLWGSQTHQSHESPGRARDPSQYPRRAWLPRPRRRAGRKREAGRGQDAAPETRENDGPHRRRGQGSDAQTSARLPHQRWRRPARTTPTPHASPVRVARQCRQPTLKVPVCLSESSACSGRGRPV